MYCVSARPEKKAFPKLSQDFFAFKQLKIEPNSQNGILIRMSYLKDRDYLKIAQALICSGEGALEEAQKALSAVSDKELAAASRVLLAGSPASEKFFYEEHAAMLCLALVSASHISGNSSNAEKLINEPVLKKSSLPRNLAEDISLWFCTVKCDDKASLGEVNRLLSDLKTKSKDSGIRSAVFGLEAYMERNRPQPNHKKVLELYRSALKTNPDNLLCAVNFSYYLIQAESENFSIDEARRVLADIYSRLKDPVLKKIMGEYYCFLVLFPEFGYARQAKSSIRLAFVESEIRKLGFVPSEEKVNVTIVNFIYLVKGTDDSRPAWYYVLVDPKKLSEFQKRVSDENIHLETLGIILSSDFGKEPPETEKDRVLEIFNIKNPEQKRSAQSSAAASSSAVSATASTTANISSSLSIVSEQKQLVERLECITKFMGPIKVSSEPLTAIEALSKYILNKIDYADASTNEMVWVTLEKIKQMPRVSLLETDRCQLVYERFLSEAYEKLRPKIKAQYQEFLEQKQRKEDERRRMMAIQEAQSGVPKMLEPLLRLMNISISLNLKPADQIEKVEVECINKISRLYDKNELSKLLAKLQELSEWIPQSLDNQDFVWRLYIKAKQAIRQAIENRIESLKPKLDTQAQQTTRSYAGSASSSSDRTSYVSNTGYESWFKSSEDRERERKQEEREQERKREEEQREEAHWREIREAKEAEESRQAQEREWIEKKGNYRSARRDYDYAASQVEFWSTHENEDELRAAEKNLSKAQSYLADAEYDYKGGSSGGCRIA